MHRDFDKLSREELLEELRCLQAQMRSDEALPHELDVLREEMQFQADRLHAVHRELELSRQRYSDLFEFAPLAYLVLDRQGLVQEINLTGVQMLGATRAYLVERPLLPYVVEADRG